MASVRRAGVAVSGALPSTVPPRACWVAPDLRPERGYSWAGRRQPITSNAISAHAVTMATRTEISVSDTHQETVVAPRALSPSFRAQVFAVVSVTLAGLIIVAIIGAMIWPLERYESAPGRAQSVANRVNIEAGDVAGSSVEVFRANNGIRFVTAMSTKVNPLQGFMGWVDPYVDVLTCEQRFGDCKPDLNRQVQMGAMTTAKEIAEFVALSYLGFEATLQQGPAQVAGFDSSVCPEDAPATRACRALEIGDTVISIDLGQGIVRVDTLPQLADVLATARAGDLVRLTVQPISGGDERTVEVELMTDPADSTRTLIGFSARDTRTVQLPFDIAIDTDRIGGPSAGLAFTLALIDALTPGELAPPGGVAVTGTISDDGSVGAIGLLLQKLIAVRQSGVKYFLVPASQSPDEIDEVRRVAGDDVDVIVVSTLTDALAALRRVGGDPIEPPR